MKREESAVDSNKFKNNESFSLVLAHIIQNE